jgi:hypothetical protein
VNNIEKFMKYVSDDDEYVRWIQHGKKYSLISAFNSRSPIFWRRAIDFINIVLKYDTVQERIDYVYGLSIYIDENVEEYEDRIWTQYKLIRERIELEEYRKKTIERRRDYASFFLIGAGTGSIYGTMGAKASFYMAPNGVSFLGSIGTDKTKWAAGIGIGFANTYKTNLHLHVLVGNRWFSEIEAYEDAVNLSATLNFDVYKRIGISIDGGCWSSNAGSSDMYDWGWSIGVYYKFSK